MTKLKVYTTLLTLVLAVAAYEMWFRHPATQFTPQDEQKLVLTITFTPEPRVTKQTRVYVEIFVNGRQLYDELLTHNWERTVQLAKGQKLILAATQEWGDRLGCTVHHAGALVSKDLRTGPGDVECIYGYGVN